MQKIVFLDIDGVLLPSTFAHYLAQSYRLSRGAAAEADEFMEFFAPHCVANVQALLRATGAAIVFSSVRRNDAPDGVARLQQLWTSRYGPAPVLGATPTLPAPQYRRGDEIRSWLARNPAAHYVILDDMGPAHFHPEQLPHLVQCSEAWGFGRAELAQALAVLVG